MVEPRTKLPAKPETHAKYKAVAKAKGWTLTKAVDAVVEDFLARHRPPRRARTSSSS